MQVEFQEEGLTKVFAKIRYNNFNLHVNRVIPLELNERDVWVQLCEKTLKDDNKDSKSIFWNDASDSNWVLMKTSSSPFSTSKAVIRIPFHECQKAFEKIRDKLKA